MEPLVSIIVPVYNVEKYLKRCIDSLLNQAYSNIEIILVNDNSTDNSGEICNYYKKKNENIKVVHHEFNSGSAGSGRNSGLKVASGDYIAFIDSDDWIHRDMIKAMINLFESHKTDIVECDLIETNTYFEKPIDFKDTIKYNVFIENRLDALKRIIKTQRFSVCVRLYERKLLNDIRFPENVISEDVYFTLAVLYKIIKIVRIEAPFYYYFTTPNSITQKTYSIKYLDSLNSGLYLQKSLQGSEKNIELLSIVQFHILKKLLYHYKMMNYFPNVDPKYVHRKRIKKLIDKNYFNSKDHNLYLNLAKVLPIRAFEFLINLNRFKHKFKKNQFQ